MTQLDPFAQLGTSEKKGESENGNDKSRPVVSS